MGTGHGRLLAPAFSHQTVDGKDTTGDSSSTDGATLRNGHRDHRSQRPDDHTARRDRYALSSGEP